MSSCSPLPIQLTVAGGRRKPSQPSLDEKLTTLSKALMELIAWDQANHSILLKVDETAVLQQAEAFLSRQAQCHPGQASPFIIGMAGGSASGKTTLKRRLLDLLELEAAQETRFVDALGLDDYYHDTQQARKQLGSRFLVETNLDTPSALDLELAQKHLHLIQQGHAVWTPSYSMETGRLEHGANLKNPAPFFVVEGLFTFSPQPMRQLMDLRIFVDTDEDTRTARWWARVQQRDSEPTEAHQALFTRAMAMHQLVVEPTKDMAEIHLNGAPDLAHIEEVTHRLAQILVRTFSPTVPVAL